MKHPAETAVHAPSRVAVRLYLPLYLLLLLLSIQPHGGSVI
jgi:hypothetical protein